MNFTLFKRSFFIIVLFFLYGGTSCSAQKKVQIGAYYFDGWTGKYPNHITPSLVENYKDREPKWGWKTSTQEFVDQQILLAADAGLDFFNFCWYYHGASLYKTEALNQALRFYKNSSNKRKLRYCLTVVNHQGSEIGPKDWPVLTGEWIEQFKDPAYQKVDGKPYLAFYDLRSLINHFGSIENLKKAVDSLKQEVKKAGLPGVNLAAMAGPNDFSVLESCGFDVGTLYNGHPLGFQQGMVKTPIEFLQKAELNFWNQMPANHSVKFIPVCTLGWDPRPWANEANGYDHTPYYTGYSIKSIEKSVRTAISWVNRNRSKTTQDKIVMLYAWNENGEGAWLTPGKSGFNPLKGVQKAAKYK